MAISLIQLPGLLKAFLKAGVWVGVIGVVLVIAIIFWLINKAGKK
jgi:hypothetical protein